MSEDKTPEVEIVSLDSSDDETEPGTINSAPPPQVAKKKTTDIVLQPTPSNIARKSTASLSTPTAVAKKSTNNFMPPAAAADEPKTKRTRPSRELKKLGVTSILGKFDPENSNRERRKLNKKIKAQTSKTGHDSQGNYHGTTINICDCLEGSCPGCFFRCKTCSGKKCGIECRRNRPWVVESIENEADHSTFRNPYLVSSVATQ